MAESDNILTTSLFGNVAADVRRRIFAGGCGTIRPLALMPFGNSNEESQRDSGLQPRVARNELPWETGPTLDNPNGVASRRRTCGATPLGLKNVPVPTQGSSFLATLGWRTQPRWGCRAVLNARLVAQRSSERNYRKALLLPRIVHSLFSGARPAPGSAGFQTCCVADFQVGRVSDPPDTSQVWKPALQQAWKPALQNGCQISGLTHPLPPTEDFGLTLRRFGTRGRLTSAATWPKLRFQTGSNSGPSWLLRLPRWGAVLLLLLTLVAGVVHGQTAPSDSPNFALDTRGASVGSGGSQGDSGTFTLDTTGGMAGAGTSQGDSGSFTLDTRGGTVGAGVSQGDSANFTLDTRGGGTGTEGISQGDSGNFTVDTRAAGRDEVWAADSSNFIVDTRDPYTLVVSRSAEEQWPEAPIWPATLPIRW